VTSNEKKEKDVLFPILAQKAMEGIIFYALIPLFFNS